MPNFNKHASTEHSVSQNYYGSKDEKLEGTGQGNKFSGDMCRDVSYLIIRQIERQLIGIFFVNEVTKEKLQCIAVAFVNDANLMLEGPKAFKIIQQMLNTCN